ncbi:MAG TPA: hypothetical protein VN922_05215 [Bacteroidia bacterium]|nr:hypothetical protein [Bacteroidia bacterium]
MAEQEEAVDATRGKKVDPNRHPRARIGKTLKDRTKGAKQRNWENKQARADWQNNGGAFPYAHCNGKRNKSVYTGKGNTQIRVTIKVGATLKGKR